MVQRRLDADFLQEPVAPDPLGEVGTQDLDRDGAVVLEVPGQVPLNIPRRTCRSSNSSFDRRTNTTSSPPTLMGAAAGTDGANRALP